LSEPAKVSLIVVAAGRGSRLGGDEPKQYRLCAGRSLLCHTLEALSAAHDFCATTVVIHPDDIGRYEQAVASLPAGRARSLGPPAFGGATRQASVLAGLEAQAAQGVTPDLVLIHDGARAFPSTPLFRRAISAAARYGAAAPGTRLNDTIKEVGEDGLVVATPSRTPLRAVQTPQGFHFDLILDAHRQAARAGIEGLTDDAAVAEWTGRPAHIFEGEPDNVKITTMDDFLHAEARLFNQAGDIRVGQGFDVHAFAEGDHLWLGGVKIPHSRTLSGHSDADVVLHAITDALLGAIGEGDIGVHFPPTDPRWRGVESGIFLSDAVRRVGALNGIVAHLDATVVCEAPRIGPFREAMRARIAGIVGLDVARVGVKATTSEGLGFTGRGEGVACIASATVRLPWRNR
jgi:2-C-methyl-D-erythritol 4-phosphate cytidylyltransferase / 2-C-methyl-D-erythritol 2,4-cyclodiphosphate synthase